MLLRRKAERNQNFQLFLKLRVLAQHIFSACKRLVPPSSLFLGLSFLRCPEELVDDEQADGYIQLRATVEKRGDASSAFTARWSCPFSGPWDVEAIADM